LRRFEDLLGGLGPDEGLQIGVPVVHPGANVVLQRLDALVHSPADKLVDQVAELSPDLVASGGADRSEVHVEAGCPAGHALIAGVL
jgi:hypothetical protein